MSCKLHQSWSCAGSSGTFLYNFNEEEMWEQNTEEYILYVTAIDPNTTDTVTLRGAFRVFGHQEKYFCTFNMINTGTDPISQEGSLEFISVGNAKKIMCEIDGNIHPCKLQLIFVAFMIMMVPICMKPILQKNYDLCQDVGVSMVSLYHPLTTLNAFLFFLKVGKMKETYLHLKWKEKSTT